MPERKAAMRRRLALVSGDLSRRVSSIALAAAIVAIVAACAWCQAPRPAFEAFEVAVITPTPAEFKGRYIRMESAHEFVAKGHTLKTLVAAAYNVTPRTISGGPSWIDSDRYDILAKAPGEAVPNLDEQMRMLRKLLDDRFSLKFHREQKEMSLYELTVSKSGPKLKAAAPAPADAPPQGLSPLIFVVYPTLVRLPAHSASMAELASVMQRAVVDLPVVDKTGLSGRYDFDLEFTPDETQFGGALGAAPPDSAKPGLFAALQQQLGLKLEAAKGPVDTLAIDSVERPSDN